MLACWKYTYQNSFKHGIACNRVSSSMQGYSTVTCCSVIWPSWMLTGRATSRATTPTRSPPLPAASYRNARLSPHRHHPWCLRRMLCGNSGPYDDTVVNTVHRSPPSLPPPLTGTSPQHPHLRQQRAPQKNKPRGHAALQRTLYLMIDAPVAPPTRMTLPAKGSTHSTLWGDYGWKRDW